MMADGSFKHDIEALITTAVNEAMKDMVPFNELRRKMAALGKQQGKFVTGTNRIDGIIHVSYDGGADVMVTETAAYKKAISVSTW
jgi:hypothetical protein